MANTLTTTWDCNLNCYNYTLKVINNIMNNVKYDTSVNPMTSFPVPLTILGYFIMVKTVGFSTRGTVSVAAGFGMLWIDPNLRWDPTMYNNVSQVLVPTSSIWMPTLALLNGVAESLIISIDKQMYVTVFYTGVVRVNIARQFHATCQLDLTNFPFDSHNCSFTIQNWDLRTSTTGSVFMVTGTTAVTDVYNNEGEMSLVGSYLNTVTYCYSSLYSCFSTLNATLVYKRSPSYYITNIIIPSFVLTFMAGLVFLIPSDSSVKIGMACSIMVALYVLQQAVTQLMPATSKTPRLAMAVMTELGLVAFSLVSAVFTVLLRSLQPTISAPLLKLIKLFKGCNCSSRSSPSEKQSAESDLAFEKRITVRKSVGPLLSAAANNLLNRRETSKGLLRLVSELIRFNQVELQQAKALEALRLKQLEHAENWKILDIFINFVLLLLYILGAVLSVTMYF